MTEAGDKLNTEVHNEGVQNADATDSGEHTSLGDKIKNMFYLQILNICISDCLSKLKFLNHEISKTKTQLSNNYDKDFLTNFFKIQNMF